jgi:hypothetical protein
MMNGSTRVFRKIASNLTSTAVATTRFATALPVGVARSVLERLGVTGSAPDVTPDAAREDTAARAPVVDIDPSVGRQATAATKPSKAPPRSTTPSKTRKSGTPKAGDVDPQRSDDEGPQVVLAMDAPPEEIEPPVDVVGEALAAEAQEQEQKQQVRTSDPVDDEDPVVYSTATDER